MTDTIILTICIPIALLAGFLWGFAFALYRTDRNRRRLTPVGQSPHPYPPDVPKRRPF